MEEKQKSAASTDAEAQPPSERGPSLLVTGTVEPWATTYVPEVRVGVWHRKRKRELLTSSTLLQSGFFQLELPITPDIAIALRAGKIDVAALDSRGRVLGMHPLFSSGKQQTIGVRLQIAASHLGGGGRVEAEAEIISPASIRRLAERVARLQRVGFRSARVPHAVAAAIVDLNEVGKLAARVATGDGDAAKQLKTRLIEDTFSSPGGAPVPRFGRTFQGMSDALKVLEGVVPGRGCGPAISRAIGVLEAGFSLDLRDRTVDARWTRRARAFVRNRFRTIAPYEASVERGLQQPYEDLPPEVPPGDGSPTGGLIGPDEPDVPVPEPDSGEGTIGTDLCEQLFDLCTGLFEEAVAATLADEVVDLIAAVTPNCLKHDFDRNQSFVGTPAAGRGFGAAQPAGVEMYFKDQIATDRIVPNSWVDQQITFQLPSRNPSVYFAGSIYLRTVGARPPSQVSRRLSNTCGRVFPDLPHEILLDRSPAAHVSVIHPPVFVELTADGAAMPPPAEACRPVNLCWITHLIGQAPTAPILPCGSIMVTVIDDTGAVAGSGGATGCIAVTSNADRTYTATAVSFAGAEAAGESTAQLVLARAHYLYLEWNQPQPDPAFPDPFGAPVQGGNNGTFNIRSSCPAAAGGLPVALASTGAISVSSPVVIPEGADRVQASFTSTAACQSSTVSATAAGHTSRGDLSFDVYVPPVLVQWTDAAGNPSADPVLRSDQPLDVFVETTCIPDHPHVRWEQVDAAGNAEQLSSQPLLVAPNRFRVTLQGSAVGSWTLRARIPFRNHAVAQTLPFSVIPQPTFTITVTPSSRDIEWGEETTFNVDVAGQYGFVGPIQLSLDGLPTSPDVTTEFLDGGQLSPMVNVTAMNQTGARILRLRTTRGGLPLGNNQFRVVGTSSQAAAHDFADLVVRRTHGNFVEVPVPLLSATGSQLPEAIDCNCRPASLPNCNAGVQAVVTVGGTAARPEYKVQFKTMHGSSNAEPSAPLFHFSHGCRIGLLIPPGATNLRTRFFNLGFPRSVFSGSPVGIGKEIKNLQANWQAYYFSPDESLVLLWGSSGNTMGSGSAQLARLYDLIENREVGQPQGFTGLAPFAAVLNPPSGVGGHGTVVFSFVLPDNSHDSINWRLP